MAKGISKAAVVFQTTDYRNAHGKSPRGSGSWAFCSDVHYGQADYLDHTFWSSGSFSDAKKAARAHFAALGFRYVVVCS